MRTSRGWLTMLIAWGYTLLVAAFACAQLGAPAAARVAADAATVTFALTVAGAVGYALLRFARGSLERRLRAAGTAWPPAPEG